MSLILVRYVGEIGIKGKNRIFFVRRLRRNLRAALKREAITGQVWSEGQRIMVEVEEAQRDLALDALKRVFGVSSLSPATRIASDLEMMKKEAQALAKRAGLNSEMSFRVRARRADKSFPYKSPEIGRLVGSAVYEVAPARVDLSDRADLTIGLEVRPEGTLIYGNTVPGPGGMPIGTQGRVFVLLSGGIDSPVAMWLMMRRGCGVIPLHFSSNETETQKALDNCKALERWSAGWHINPVLGDHNALLAPIVQKLRQRGEGRWACLFCKRAMLAYAAELAPKYHVQAVVMGDSLGQVASQTLSNMAVITWGTNLPILRPLIAYDKNDIMDLGRKIGTFDISIRHAENCVFVPHNPITNAKILRLQEIIQELAE